MNCSFKIFSLFLVLLTIPQATKPVKKELFFVPPAIAAFSGIGCLITNYQIAELKGYPQHLTNEVLKIQLDILQNRKSVLDTTFSISGAISAVELTIAAGCIVVFAAAIVQKPLLPQWLETICKKLRSKK